MNGLETYLRAKRGRASELARHLGVNRQNVHRWFKGRHTNIPGWVCVTTNIWFHSRPPGERQGILELPERH